MDLLALLGQKFFLISSWIKQLSLLELLSVTSKFPRTISTIDSTNFYFLFRVHLMSGTVNNKSECEHLTTYISNLKIASQKLNMHNMTGVIEPINGYVIPKYFMNSYIKGRSFITTLV